MSCPHGYGPPERCSSCLGVVPSVVRLAVPQSDEACIEPRPIDEDRQRAALLRWSRNAPTLPGPRSTGEARHVAVARAAKARWERVQAALPEGVLTIERAAARAQVSTSTFRRVIRRGEVTPQTVTAAGLTVIVVAVAEVDRMISNRSARAAELQRATSQTGETS